MVYENQNDKAVYIGDVTAPSYESAMAFVISQGIDKKDFILVKKDD